MVAENSATWRVGGVASSTFSTSSMKPMRSISSASSRTRNFSSDRSSVPRIQMVDHAAGRADHDMHAALERVQLRAVALAAVDRQHLQAGQMRGVALERFGDLDGQLARRRQHQRLRLAGLEVDARKQSAARTRRSCRCRSAPGRARRGLPSAAEWWRPGSAMAIHNRRRSVRAAHPDEGQAQRSRRLPAGNRKTGRTWGNLDMACTWACGRMAVL